MSTAFGGAIRAGMFVATLAFGVQAADAATFKVLHHFDGATTGGHPTGALTLDYADGFLFGTTTEGGAHGFGTAFEVSVYGDFFQTIHAFTPAEGRPKSRMILRNGGLFGTACDARGGGVVYRLGFDRVFHTLYTFVVPGRFEAPKEPLGPTGGIDIDRLGNLYGVTSRGGENDTGTVYKVNINSPGVATRLTSFDGPVGRANVPVGGVVYYGGYIYGTTSPIRGGGTTLFRLPSTGGKPSVLSTFGDHSLYAEQGDLIFDNGVVGTLPSAGPNRVGVLFRYTPEGGLSHLFDFEQDIHNLAYFPVSGVIAHGGYYYGTTMRGGKHFGDPGTVYKFKPGAIEPVLIHEFHGSDGELPTASLTIDPQGNIYGVTTKGGRFGHGVIFKIEP